MSLTIETSILHPGTPAMDTSLEENENPTQFEELRLFQEKFEEHMPSARKPKKYDHVGVLLLSFAPTSDIDGMKNMDVSEEVKNLHDVFRNEYNFDVTNRVIPCDEFAHIHACRYLCDFGLEHAKKVNSLRIIYYAGHGWRSRDHNPTRAYGYDLMPEVAQRGKLLPEGTYIMWDQLETTLQGFKQDVLVIFDCCDAGFLSMRGSGHAFEYLAACGSKKKTREPGPHSFTSALIWALRKLKPVAPFTMQKLKEQIKQYDDFPDTQEPLIFTRPDHVAGPVSMAPIESGMGEPSHRSSSIASRNRPEERSFVDLRLFFTRNVTVEDAEHVAKMVSPAIQSRKLKFNATHISVLDQGKVFKLLKFRNQWRRARDSIGFLSHSRKRARIQRSETLSRTLQRSETASTPARPVTPVSDSPRSETETQVSLPKVHIDPGATSLIDIHVPLVINTQDSSGG